MIQIEGLQKSYGTQSVFDGANLTLVKGERVGLVGRNGSGKSTLMRIIIGQEKQNSGNISMPTGYILGYLRQDIRFSCNTVLSEVMSTLKAHEDGVDESYRAKVVLSGLGFDSDDFKRSPRELSGGFQVRLNLAKTLVSEPDLLLLDEPTNYLDIVSIRWLSGFLRDWRGELVLITHDRGFMDSVTTHTAGIVRRKIKKIPGGTAELYEQLELDDQHYEQRRLNIEKSKKDSERFITRFRAKATKARAVKSRVKLLEKQGTLKKLQSEDDLNFRFTPMKLTGKNMLEASGLGFEFDGCGPLFKELSFNIRKGDRIAIIGQNGRGKTTLMKVLSEELAPTDGTVSLNKNSHPACFGQTNINRLNPEFTVEQEIMASLHEPSVTRARTLAGTMMFSGESVLKKTRILSGGEKSRVMLAKVLATPSNLLLLDEPSNHLDMQSTESLINAIVEFDGAVVFITHSERILNELAERLIVFDRGKCMFFEGTYMDFLERVGWETDTEKTEAQCTDKKNNDSIKNLSKKNIRKLRAEIVAERSNRLRPLKARIDKLEGLIMEKEGIVETDTNGLLRASEACDGDEISRLSKSIHATRTVVESSYDELAAKSEEYDRLKKQYKKRLSGL